MPGYVLVRPDEATKETASGIYIEQESTEVNTGRIVEVGTDLIMEKNILPCPVQIGDHIYHKKFAGMSSTTAFAISPSSRCWQPANNTSDRSNAPRHSLKDE